MIDQYQPVSLLALFMIGLLGSGHCVAMCGGITTALGMAADPRRAKRLVIGYNLGRISGYALAGVLVATLGYWGKSHLALGPVLRILAGLILVLMGLYLAGWWRVLVKLEKLGTHLWKRLQPLATHFMPVSTLGQALAVGLVWGWLPCGLVYSALAYAAASAHPLEGAALMVAFGLGTSPAMVAGGLFSGAARRFLQAPTVRIVTACAMIGFGVWTLWMGATHLPFVTPGDSGHMHSH